ncbi:hypothetical protein I0K01_03795 [Xanthomonas oryzae pv. oryzae]
MKASVSTPIESHRVICDAIACVASQRSKSCAAVCTTSRVAWAAAARLAQVRELPGGVL